MKLAMCSLKNNPAVCVESNARWFNFTEGFSVYQSLRGDDSSPPLVSTNDMIARGLLNKAAIAEALDALSDAGRLDSCEIAAPSDFLVPIRAGKIVALGRNYAAHAEELGNEVPGEPMLFCKSPSICIADGNDILLRESYGRVDFEGELAFIVGKKATDIRAEDAREYVAGYTLLNDVTERDMQGVAKKKGHPWFRAKNLDTFCPLGPVITLAEDMPWPLHVDIELQVNGETRQQSNTSLFIFDIPTMLAFITRFMTLEPGDIVTTGTPAGVAPIHPGDRIELTVPEIGTLTNAVASIPG
jgi:2-keto-4-pentenoate hydratase/2-oxohepta-3-ene-1,7-dioic acid hydratase in catechol pathway